MLRVCTLGLASALLLASVANAELAEIRPTAPSYVVRQGTRQLAVFAERSLCELDAQVRTPAPTAPRRSFTLRSGGGVVLATLSSEADCLAAPVNRLTADGARRPTPPKLKESNVNSCVMTTNFSAGFQPPTCVATHNFIATYVAGTAPPPSCTQQPSTETRTCPAGTSGTWTQSSTIGPYPGCAVTWSPSSPPADRCPPNPVPTGPVLTLTVANILEVNLAWSTVSNARAYEVEKCRGAGCTNFTRLACTQATRTTDVLPATATARYRVRGNSEINCSGAGGTWPYSSPQQVTVGGTVNTGQAFLSWTPPTTNSNDTALTDLAGYYVVYGTSPSNLDRQIILSNGGLTSYTVSDLPAGTWYFALKAYTTNFANISNLSNIVSKTVR